MRRFTPNEKEISHGSIDWLDLWLLSGLRPLLDACNYVSWFLIIVSRRRSQELTGGTDKCDRWETQFVDVELGFHSLVLPLNLV